MKPKRGLSNWFLRTSTNLLKVDTSEFSYIAPRQHYDLSRLRKLIDGDLEFLSTAFVWKYTNQGRDYWASKTSSLPRKVSVEDRAYFVWLLKELEGRGYVETY